MTVTLPYVEDTTDVIRVPAPVTVRSCDRRSTLWNGVDLNGGMLVCGQWISQSGELKMRLHAHREMFTFVSGLIDLVEADGAVSRMGPAQVGFTPKDWTRIRRTVGEAPKTDTLLKALSGDAG
ncbi:MAG: hypothetical protein AAF367_06570 [Pseudomonadota bacterium]